MRRIANAADIRPRFYRKELKKKLGKLKKFKAIKKIGRKERRVVDDLLHKILR